MDANIYNNITEELFSVLNNEFLFLVYSLIMQEWFDVYLILGLLALERFLTSVPVYWQDF